MAGWTGVRPEQFKSGGSNNGRKQWIFSEPYQVRFSLGPTRSSGGDDRPIMRFSGLAIPFGVMLDVPCQRFIVVATPGRTAIGDTEFFAEVGAWDAQAMVEAVVDAHVGAAGHVAFHTEMAFTKLAVVHLLVKMVVFRIIQFSPVALRTQIVFFFVELKAVDIVTVAAAHPALIHLTLDERAVNIDFFQYLAVRIVEAFPQ